MRKTVFRMRKTLRFRRWSRKAYSILVSLRNHVTVGQVCKSIAEASCRKSSQNVIATEGSNATDVCCNNFYPDDRPEDVERSYNTNTLNMLNIAIGETVHACNCPDTELLYLKYKLATAG